MRQFPAASRGIRLNSIRKLSRKLFQRVFKTDSKRNKKKIQRKITRNTFEFLACDEADIYTKFSCTNDITFTHTYTKILIHIQQNGQDKQFYEKGKNNILLWY